MPPPEALAEAQRWPAHRAAFEDDDEELARLAEGWGAEEWAARDCCGNSVVHVAALRGSLRCLRLAFGSGHVEADSKNSAGWTPFQEAVAAGDAKTARLIFDLAGMGGGGDEQRSELRLSSLAALGRVPDFRIRIRWRFGANPLVGLLVKKYAPSDAYEVRKRGDRLRVDGSLLGMDLNEKSFVPKWRRGGFSLLLGTPPEGAGEGGGEGGRGDPTVYVINHETRCFASTRAKPPELPPPPPPRARLSVGVASAHDGARDRDRDGSDGSDGGGPLVRCRLWAESPPPKTADDVKFEVTFFRGVMGKEELVPDSPSFRQLRDWRGGPLSDRVDGVATQIYEASTRLRSTQVVKTNRYVLGRSFAHYVAAREHATTNFERSELLHLPVSYDDLMVSAGMRQRDDPEAQGSWLRARVWLAPKFPLNVQHMLLLLEVIATANKTARRMMAALQVWRDTEAFPMKVHMPLMMSIFAQLVCSGYAPCTAADAPDSCFELPADYKERDLADILAESVGVEGDASGEGYYGYSRCAEYDEPGFGF